MATDRNVEALLPLKLGADGGVHYAQGIRAGRWVFATGHMAQDFKSGMAADVMNVCVPHSGAPKREKEASLIFDHIEAVLAAGGTEISNVVRTDQYYTTVHAVPPYQAARRSRFGALIPPSTSIVEQGFVLPGADINLQTIAVIPDDGFTPEHLQNKDLAGRPTSGYSPALTVGDFVFVPGITSMAQGDEPRRNAVAEAALIEQGMQWGGQSIKLETEFIITNRITQSLALAGATLDDIVKAQIYLSDPDDYSACNDAWIKHFGDTGPALSIIPCATEGLAVIDGKIEINVLALKSGTATKKEHITADVETAFQGQVQAVRAGDLLFLSGLMANDAAGLIAGAERDPNQPWFSSPVAAQADCIIANAEKLCQAAGTSLRNAVRIQQFHTDISEFYPTHRAWQRHLPDTAIPFSAVHVPHALPVPGTTLLMDIWVYAP